MSETPKTPTGIPDQRLLAFETPPRITPQDVEAIRSLLEEVREMERREQLALAIGAWMGAYRSFRTKERKLGLPENPRERLFYGAMVAQLRSAGKALLGLAEEEKLDFTPLKLTAGDFAACLNLLSVDDDWAEHPLSAEEESQVRAALS